jgi:hypothetical protein
VQELRTGLYVTHSAPGFKFSKRANSFADSSAADTAAARDLDAAPANCRGAGLAGATQLAGGAAAASVRSRAVALAHALDRVGPVRVSNDRLVMPVEYLRAALQQCLLLQINEMVMASDVSTRGWHYIRHDCCGHYLLLLLLPPCFCSL